MSGVILEDGVQWEHCNVCAKWVRLDNLGYMKPSKKNPYGLNICMDCTNKLSQWHLVRVIPATRWVAKRE